MITKRNTLAGGLVFVAFTSLFGILGHLLSELLGLGWHDDAAVVVSERHIGLLVLATAALGAFAYGLSRSASADRSRRAERLVRQLPFAGSGWRFVSVAFVAQLGCCAVTQAAEGAPMSAGNVELGLFAALVTAVLGAFAISFCQRRVLALGLAIIWAIRPRARGSSATHAFRARRAPAHRPVRRSAFAFRYRPPPIAA